MSSIAPGVFVFNKAVTVIPLSADLWAYFIHFIAEWKNGEEGSIRQIYERAVNACSGEFKSDKIWEAFVEWEKQTDKTRVLELYKRFLSCIVHNHQHHFDKFREWIFVTPVKEMCNLEQLRNLLIRHSYDIRKRKMEAKKAEKLRDAEEQRIRQEELAAAMDQVLPLPDSEASNQETSEKSDSNGGVSGDTDENTSTQETVSSEMSQLNVSDTEAKAPDDQNGNVEEECGQDENLEDDTKLQDVTNKDRDAITINKTETDSPFDDGDEAIVEEMISEEGSSEKQNDITTHEETVINEKSMVPEDDLPSSLDGVTLKHEAAVREQILLEMAPIHERILGEIEEVLQFEEGIKRPYFHVKELERAQLKNWKNYLNFAISKGDNERTKIIFERCLIACAFYEGFWIKYANFMRKIDLFATSEIYQRACLVHLVKKPQVHLCWAAFEEECGNIEAARIALQHIEDNLPGLVAITMRRAHLERRAGNKDDGLKVLKKALDKCTHRDTIDYLIGKYVAYLQYVIRDVETAKTYIMDHLEKTQKNRKLYLRLMELEFTSNQSVPDHNKICQIFDLALSSSLSDEEKTLFSHRKMAYLEEFSDCISSIIKAYDDHSTYYKKSLTQQSPDENKRLQTQARTTEASNSNTSNSYNTQNNNLYYIDYNDPANRKQQMMNTQYSNQTGYYGMNQAAYQQQYQQWYHQYAAQQYSTHSGSGHQYTGRGY